MNDYLGLQPGNHKLTEAQVIEMRKAWKNISDQTAKDLESERRKLFLDFLNYWSEKCKVTPNNIRYVLQCKSWNYINLIPGGVISWWLPVDR